MSEIWGSSEACDDDDCGCVKGEKNKDTRRCRELVRLSIIGMVQT